MFDESLNIRQPHKPLIYESRRICSNIIWYKR